MSPRDHFIHCCLVMSLLSLSSAMVRWILFPWGGEIRGVAFVNNENVGKSSVKAVATGIFHMNFKRTRVSLAVGDHIHAFQVSTSRNHAQVTSVKLDEISNLASHQINLNGVIHLDEGLKAADGANIMGHQMQDSFCPTKIFLTMYNLHLASLGVIQ